MVKPLPQSASPAGSVTGIEWRSSAQPVAYPEAVAWMEARVAQIAAGEAGECVWLLEHPPLYTAGTSARPGDLLAPARFPVFRTGRGGQYTYHGPGQRVAYVMLDLRRRGRDVRRHVDNLEQWMIATLARFGVEAGRREGRIGVWVRRPGAAGLADEKIGAIGVRLRHWVSYHGISLNVAPDLEHYAGIVPCGLREYGVTSLEALGIDASMAEVDIALKSAFGEIFG